MPDDRHPNKVAAALQAILSPAASQYSWIVEARHVSRPKSRPRARVYRKLDITSRHQLPNSSESPTTRNRRRPILRPALRSSRRGVNAQRGASPSVIAEPTKANTWSMTPRTWWCDPVESWSFDAELPEEALRSSSPTTTSITPPLPAAPRASEGQGSRSIVGKHFPGCASTSRTRSRMARRSSSAARPVSATPAPGARSGTSQSQNGNFASNAFTSFASPTARSPSTGRAVTTSDSSSTSGSSPCAN